MAVAPSRDQDRKSAMEAIKPIFSCKHHTMAEAVQGQQHERSALVLYGSETGNSQDVAEELGRMAERLRFVTRVSEMDLVEIVRPFISQHRDFFRRSLIA